MRIAIFPNPAPTSLKEVEVVAHLMGRLVVAGARVATARVRPTKNQQARQAMAVVEVVVAEMILAVRTMVVLSLFRIQTTKIQVTLDIGNQHTKKRSSNVLRCRTPYATERG